MKILTISPMYPNAHNPGFGCFIEQIETVIEASSQSVQYLHAIRYKSRESRVSKLISYSSWIIRALWMGLSKKYDIIHAHTVFPAGALALVISFFRNKAILITIHGSDICLISDKSDIVQRVAKKALSKADSIQAVSDYIKSRIVDFLPQASHKIFVQCMGVDLSLFKPGIKSYQMATEVNIIFVGNIVEKKGWKEAFQTVEKLILRGVNCRLNVYGNGSDNSLAKDWIVEHGLGKTIIMYGEKQKDIIVNAMQNADFLLFPSKYDEAFSLVTAEALACGTPVVASARGALPHLISGIEGSFSIPNSCDADLLADACQASLKYNKKRIGKPILSQLNKKYSLDTSSKRVIDIYQHIFDRK